MFRSLTDSIRSFWSSSTDETEKIPTGSKRKSSTPVGSDDNGKRQKLENQSTLGGLVRHSVTKMAYWLKPKSKAFSEDFRAMPYYQSAISGRTSLAAQENGSHRSQNHVSRINGEETESHQRDSSICPYKLNAEKSGNDANVQFRRGSDKSSLSRHPSDSSIFGLRKRSMANESIRLKEREQYQKLLQLQGQRSPWQAKIPMSFPGGLSSSVPKKYVRPPDTSDGKLRNCIELAELQKASAMSSLSSRQRYRSEVSVPLPSASFRAEQSYSTSLKTHLTQRHTREGLNSHAFLSSSLEKRGPISVRRDLVTKGKETSNDLIVLNGNGDWEELGDKTNGNIDREDTHSVKRIPETIVIDDDDDEVIERRVPPIKTSQSAPGDWFSLESNRIQACYKRCQAHAQEKEKRRNEIEEEEMKAKAYEEKRRLQTLNLEKQMKYQMRIFDELPEVTEDIFLEDEEEEEELPELDDDMMDMVRTALRPGNPSEVLSDAFRLQITRRDIATLAGLNWLNDEVINFYMNMLMERGEKEGQAKVYAFNTFFYPKIMSGGHSAVKRWTKKVDIFSVHFIIIPVHLGMHWCLCVVDMEKKAITYYDSMGATNNPCLQAVLNYINDESVAKKQTPIKKSDWSLINAEDNPQQLNGSDCGMFLCKYAEYITRRKELTFTQEDMPYFRQRMIYEIISKRLLQ